MSSHGGFQRICQENYMFFHVPQSTLPPQVQVLFLLSSVGNIIRKHAIQLLGVGPVCEKWGLNYCNSTKGCFGRPLASYNL